MPSAPLVERDVAVSSYTAPLDRLHEPRTAVTWSGSDTGDGTRAKPTGPEDRWRALADGIDRRLTATAVDWVGLAATLQQAAAHGYDLNRELPRLATAEPLPESQPALELQYRVIAAIELPVTDPAAADRPPPDRPPSPPSTAPGRGRPRGPTP
jgi:hypothetical protein